MNYFERLVRRVVQQPAQRAGAGLYNPFEQVAEWPLKMLPSDAPAAAPGLAAPVAQSAIPTPAESGREAVATPGPDPAPAAASELRPAVSASAMLAAAQERRPRRPPDVDPEPHRSVAVSPANHAAPQLGHADEFLRSLGVAVPELPPAASIAVPAVPHVAPSPHPPELASPQRQTTIAAITPPTSPSAPTARPAPAVSETQRSARRERATTEPSPSHQAVPQRREVVIVERLRGSTGSAPAGRLGVGSPHVGLGQL
jgi:hypothetical protein